MSFPPQVEQWRPLFQRLGGDLPTTFLLGWLAKESGGNPCSLGIPGVEAGIFQTYHPNDDKYGASFAQLRAACSNSSLTRPLTAEERELQVRSGLGLVRDYKNRAKVQLAQSRVGWSEGSTDFWTWVKLQHALPAVAALLPTVVARLGRAPRNFGEFHQVVSSIPVGSLPTALQPFKNAASVRGLPNRMEDAIANAEEVGAFGGGFLGVSGTAGTLLKIALVGVAAWGAYELVMRYTPGGGGMAATPAPTTALATNPARRRRAARRRTTRSRRAA